MFVMADLFDAFGAGVYLLFGVIHLDLWMRRKDRLGHLLLAGASLSALSVDLSGMAARHMASETTGVVLVFNVLGVAGATACLFELVSTLKGEPTPRFARALQWLILLLSPVAGLLVHALFPVIVAVCGLMLVWAMVRAFGAARRGDRESGIVARGFIVLTVCLVADVLKAMHLLSVPRGLPILGFVVLFLASARSLNDRFEREEEASRTDSMTGLPNRRGFLEAGDAALVRSRRSGRPVSVVLGDLDHFKDVNDSLGHAAGDEALRTVAGAIRSGLRAQDVAARWGGEEFILLLPDTALEGAQLVAESLRAAIAALSLGDEEKRIAVTVSLGVAEHRRGLSLEDTIAEADAALYRAKQAGRNRVETSPR